MLLPLQRDAIRKVAREMSGALMPFRARAFQGEANRPRQRWPIQRPPHEEIVRPVPQKLDRERLVVRARENDDRHIRRAFAQLKQHAEAGAVRKIRVEQKEIDTAIREQLEGHGEPGRGLDCKPSVIRLSQQRANPFDIPWIMGNQQNLDWGTGGHGRHSLRTGPNRTYTNTPTLEFCNTLFARRIGRGQAAEIHTKSAWAAITREWWRGGGGGVMECWSAGVLECWSAGAPRPERPRSQTEGLGMPVRGKLRFAAGVWCLARTLDDKDEL